MRKIPYSIRQGDVLLVEANYRGGIPKNAKLINENNEDVILAHGEATGHAHRIDKNVQAKYLDYQAERYLQVVCEAPLTHEEHSMIPILPKKYGYQQLFQVEDFGKEIKRVID